MEFLAGCVFGFIDGIILSALVFIFLLFARDNGWFGGLLWLFFIPILIIFVAVSSYITSEAFGLFPDLQKGLERMSFSVGVGSQKPRFRHSPSGINYANIGSAAGYAIAAIASYFVFLYPKFIKPYRESDLAQSRWWNPSRKARFQEMQEAYARAIDADTKHDEASPVNTNAEDK